MLYSSNNNKECNEKFILMENRGVDGIELTNKRLVTFDIWKKLLVDISYTLNILHSNDIIHCNIKSENVIFDKQMNRWSLIDFGVVGKYDGFYRFVGSLQYCSPHVVDNNINDRSMKASLKHKMKNTRDIYSFAITALIMFGYDYHFGIIYFKLNVKHLIEIYNGNIECIMSSTYLLKNATNDKWTRNVLRVLSAIVLTQTDIRCEFIRWDRMNNTCEFVGQNNMQCDVKYNIHDYWDELNTIIKK